MDWNWPELIKLVITAILGWLSGIFLPVPGKTKSNRTR